MLYNQIIKNFLPKFPQFKLVDIELEDDHFKVLVEKTKVMPIKTTLTEKILEESSFRRNSGTIENVAEYFPDLGSKIGGDVNGIAYDYEGKVAKFTMSFDEARLLSFFIKKMPKHFARVYSVEEVYLNEQPTNVFCIIRDKLAELSKTDYNIIYMFADALENDEDVDIEKLIPYKRESEVFKYVNKIYLEYVNMRNELLKFKGYDLKPKNLGRKKDGTLAAFDMESNISFPDMKLPAVYLNSFEDEKTSFVEQILREVDNPSASSSGDPGTMPNDFTEYMAEDSLPDRMTMETGAIPNSLDEVEKVLEELEESVLKQYPKLK
jgi:hypothetical protein